MDDVKKTYSIPKQYLDQTPAKPLSKKTLNKLVWTSLFLQASFNYERMQATGWCWAILPGLKEIHKNQSDLAASMTSNVEFFTTHPFLVTFVMGIVLSLEQKKIDIPTIRSVRVAIMGPLGGIGDGIFWMTLVPILAGITGQMATEGKIAAPFVFLAVFNIIQFTLRYFLLHWSYTASETAIQVVMKQRKAFTRAASVLGLFIVGALIVTMGSQTKINLVIPTGTSQYFVPHTTTVKQKDAELFYDKIYDQAGNPLVSTNDAGEKTTCSILDLHNGYSQITYMETVTKKNSVDVQAVLDTIIPAIIPLLITLLLYYLLNAFKWTPLKCIAFILLLALLGSGLGIWPNIWPVTG